MMALARPCYGRCLASGASFTWTLPSHWRIPHTPKNRVLLYYFEKIETLANKIVIGAVKKTASLSVQFWKLINIERNKGQRKPDNRQFYEFFFEMSLFSSKNTKMSLFLSILL
jgi:hypothetical protein